MRHSLTTIKPRTRRTPGLRQCHLCQRAYLASAKWCPHCFDDNGQPRQSLPATPYIEFQIGQEIALAQPVHFTRSVMPIGTRGTITGRNWQGCIGFRVGDVEHWIAPTYFIPQPTPVSA